MDNYYKKYLKYKMKYLLMKGGKTWEEMYNELNTTCEKESGELTAKYLELTKKLIKLNEELASRTTNKPAPVVKQPILPAAKEAKEAKEAERAKEVAKEAERAREAYRAREAFLAQERDKEAARQNEAVEAARAAAQALADKRMREANAEALAVAADLRAKAGERLRQAALQGRLAAQAQAAKPVVPVVPALPVSKLKMSNIVTPNSWKGRKIDIELYKPQSGGVANEVWPLLNIELLKGTVRKLGVRAKTDNSVNFEIVGKNLDKQIGPMFARGTFTAIYEMKNVNPTDPQEYILRIYKRESATHLVDDAKIGLEFSKFRENLIKIFYYGTIDINSNEFSLGETKDSKGNINSYIREAGIRKYNFDYIITKKYKTLQMGVAENVINPDLTNLDKFKYLYENVIMLDNMQKEKMFHSDYKPANIGYDAPAIGDLSPNTTPILIDYDFTTILRANDPTIYGNVGGYIDFNFPTTPFIEPEYIKNRKVEYIITYPDIFIKYSVGGLARLINSLNIKLTESFITLPPEIQVRNIKFVTNDLVTSLKLNNTEYENIPRYQEIINILNYLYIQKRIAS